MNEAIFFFSQQNIPFIGMKPKFPPKRSRIDYDLRMVSSWYLVGSSLRDQFLVCLEEERPGCVEQFCGLSCFLLFSPSEASCSLRRSNIKSIRQQPSNKSSLDTTTCSKFNRSIFDDLSFLNQVVRYLSKVGCKSFHLCVESSLILLLGSSAPHAACLTFRALQHNRNAVAEAKVVRQQYSDVQLLYSWHTE